MIPIVRRLAGDGDQLGAPLSLLHKPFRLADVEREAERLLASTPPR